MPLRSILCALALLVPLAAARAQAPAPGDHNVVLIMLDDAGVDMLDVYGTNPGPPNLPDARTPHLSGLAAQGITFSRAYVSSTCSPTRAMVQTGRFSVRTGLGSHITDVECPPGFDLPDGELLLAELIEQGHASTGWNYARGAFGKWHMTSYEGFGCHPRRNGYQVFRGHVGNHTGDHADHFDWVKVSSPPPGQPGSLDCVEELTWPDGPPQPDPWTVDNWDARVTRVDAQAWIDEQADPGRFFAYVAFEPPHSPVQVPPYEVLSPEMVLRLQDIGYEPGQILSTTLLPEHRITVNQAMLESVDHEIGELLDPANWAHPDQLERTVFVVVGDNGTVSSLIPQELNCVLGPGPTPVPSYQGKRLLYELGIRAPLIVSGPIVDVGDRGSVCDGLVAGTDLWRTVANLTGLSDAAVDAVLAAQPAGSVANPGDDSLSFLGLLADPDAPSARCYGYADGFIKNELPPNPERLSQTVIGTRYKYLVFRSCDLAQGPVVEREELFDLQEDCYETTNLLDGPSLTPPQQAALDELRGFLTTLQCP